MIRVLHVIEGLNGGGAESMIVNLHRAIDRDNIQFDYVITNKSEKQLFKDEVERLGGRIFVFPSFRGTNTLSLKKYWDSFFKEHREYRILHSHIRSYASIFLPVARKNGVVTIIHSHNTSNGKGIKSVFKKILQFPLRYCSDYFFSCSHDAGVWLFGKKVANSKRHFIIKNAIDTERFRFNVLKRNIIRREFGIGENCLVLGTIGRLHFQKNPDGILDIIENVISSHKSINSNIKMIWVGDGELKNYIAEKIKEKGLEEYIIMTGQRTDINDLFQAFDVFILPSFFEGLPVVAIECQASGTLCLLSNTITKDVCITDRAVFLPIDGEWHLWTNEIFTRELSKKDTRKEIVDSGYDIRSTSGFLMNFYYRCLEVRSE